MFKPRRVNARQLDERVKAERLAQTLPPLILAAENLVNAFDIGVHGRRRAGTGEDFWQFKQYGPDDPTTSIDWRQSAKREHIYIRQKEQETAETVWIWRDRSHTMNFGSDLSDQSKLDRATLLSLALALSLSKSGEKFGLIGQAEKASTGQTAFNQFVGRISEDQSPSLPDLKAADQLSNKSTVVLISDFLIEPSEITKVIRHFVNLGCRGILLQIADPVEVDLPFEGRTRFLSMTEEEDITLGRVEVVREDYKSLFNAHRQEVLNVAKNVSWDYNFHRTDAPASEAFAALYTALNIRRVKT
ncbi:DUF58 domain-containing protein [uncultured Sneathiella sp.]|uniref:DUF58 domain-containing protein n=1 Tax=uncultured Sneathiella sp. TaxID=879315 RepID=UPI002599A491|nr:DUF58 domain-containing protein [uncultured Sneathiella sp.]